jgi:hypothetical protein
VQLKNDDTETAD